jgi:hypothetical protein
MPQMRKDKKLFSKCLKSNRSGYNNPERSGKPVFSGPGQEQGVSHVKRTSLSSMTLLLEVVGSSALMLLLQKLIIRSNAFAEVRAV